MAGKADAKTSRCWPGFEPVPGKGEHEQGSCRKKPASKNGGEEVDRERSRKKQVAAGGERGKQARSKSPDASERKSVGRPKSETKKAATGTAAKKAATKKPAATKVAAKKTATRKPAAKKAAAKKAATRKAGAAAAGKSPAARVKKSPASTRKKATAAK